MNYLSLVKAVGIVLAVILGFTGIVLLAMFAPLVLGVLVAAAILGFATFAVYQALEGNL